MLHTRTVIARLLVTRAFIFAGLLLAAASPAYATFHLMQIEQVIGGVNGDTTAQAIQLRMRLGGQNLLAPARMRVFDATGANPIVIVNFGASVPNSALGSRVLIASPSFPSATTPAAVPDFTMANSIPASYLAAGSLTFETDNGLTIYWRLSWGGASYTGPNSGAIDNDPNGNFGPPWPAALPSACGQALQFEGSATAASTTNAADYSLTAGAAVFINNAGGPSNSFTVDDAGCDACTTASQCGDVDMNGLRDDPCLWYACTNGTCSSQPRGSLNGGQFGQADLGGPVGTPGSGKECNIDGVADGNDNFHALRCFADTDFQGQPMYPCEPSPPSAINVDAGSNGSCVLDGVCDGNDAFHTLRSFSDTNFLGQPGYPCSCAGPAPNGARIQPGEYTGLVVLGPRFARPDEQIDVEVYLDADINILTGFQLHLGASGGLSGHLELVDISVDDERSDSAFTGVADAWSAFNRASAQMVSGVNTMGVTARAGTYLATFTYHVPEDASGTFLVSVLYDDSGTSLDHRTFLFGEYARPIGVESLTPARISVVGQPARGRR